MMLVYAISFLIRLGFVVPLDSGFEGWHLMFLFVMGVLAFKIKQFKLGSKY
jgi:hypothetical protein